MNGMDETPVWLDERQLEAGECLIRLRGIEDRARVALASLVEQGDERGARLLRLILGEQA